MAKTIGLEIKAESQTAKIPPKKNGQKQKPDKEQSDVSDV